MNSSKISDNPSLKKIKNQIKNLKSFNKIYKMIPFSKKLFPSLEESFNEFEKIEDEAYILDLPDEFNSIFTKEGWIAYDSLNFNVIEKAIALYYEKGLEFSENYLADTYDKESLENSIFRMSGNTHFDKRMRLIELVKEDYLEKRYHACIPLLLSLVDGIVNDISKHVGFFAENVNLTAWDCISGHETGLQTLVSILTKGRNKTNEKAIKIPYRNGILHGRELAFDNKIVASKCWAVLFAIFDWSNALEKEIVETKPLTWKKVYEDVKELNRKDKLIKNWKPRQTIDSSNSFKENSPEQSVVEFLDNWSKKRYGLLAKKLMDFSSLPLKKKAGLLKEEFGKFVPISFEVLSIEDLAPAVTHINVELHFYIDEKTIKKELSIRTIYESLDGKPLIRDEKNGHWKIVKNSLSNVIYAYSLE